jgi:dipeptidyl aminopeptidase/acylaminoacyl peptidase
MAEGGGVTVAPYGSWVSPFGIELLTAGVVGLGEIRARDGVTWWLEGRADEGGRQVLVRRDPDGSMRRLTPEGFNARDRVHEYGGAPYGLAGDVPIVSEFATGRLHRVVAPEVLEPLTAEGPWRYADLAWDPSRDRLLAIREDHSAEARTRHGEAVNTIVAIALATGDVTVLVDGADFYAAPRISPDGRQVAWLEWAHPNLPWDGTELYVAPVGHDGRLGERTLVAGSPSEWISQPRWSPDGTLHFIAEPTGWMHLHRWRDGHVERITDGEIEFAYPDWLFGFAQYGFLPDGSILAAGRSRGRDRLYRIAPGTPAVELDVPSTEISGVTIDGERVVFRGSEPTAPGAIQELELATGGLRVLRRSSDRTYDPASISVPQPIAFPTTGDREAYGLYYAPRNPTFRGTDGERPPLIVTSHGGPTSQASTALNLTIQLFTTRGIAVLDVDYGGSTGYGREYRKRLEGTWGVTDVDDCVAGARFLAERGDIDPSRVAVRGGSASGFTTLSALAFRDEFAAGISYFGLGDLLAFARETHKFESRYLDRLVGPLPEAEATYRERSPSLHTERMSAPVLVLQGAEDRIVPVAEAERIVDALFERGIPHAYVLFPGEDHGFRGAAAIIRAFQAELSFLGEVFGFTPADELPPLELVRPPVPSARSGEPTRAAS